MGGCAFAVASARVRVRASGRVRLWIHIPICIFLMFIVIFICYIRFSDPLEFVAALSGPFLYRCSALQRVIFHAAPARRARGESASGGAAEARGGGAA